MHAQQPYILKLADAVNAPVGGKAKGLAELIAMGLNVPAGFVIINATADTLPDDLLAHYEAIGAGLVAVRSSALGEDSAAASFAGQYETILNVQGEAALKQAIIDCLTSLDNQRSQAYQERAGIQGAQMSVVVQKMAPAAYAGVLFTVDPVSGDRSRLVIDAARGLGEAVVSGEVTPDHYEVDYQGRILTQDLTSDAPLLAASALKEMVAVSLAAAHRAGHPLDMEWALDDQGVIYWLQARPVTTLGGTLYELDTPVENERDIYTLCNVSEALPGAMCPLTLSVTNQGLEVGMQRLNIDFGLLEKEDLSRWTVMLSRGGHLFMNMNTLSVVAVNVLGGKPDGVALSICGRLIPELDVPADNAPFTLRMKRIGRYLKTLFSGNNYRARMDAIIANLSFPSQSSALGQWRLIENQMEAIYAAHHCHLASSMLAGAMVPTLLGIVSKGGEQTDEHHTTVASWLAGAEDVESADIAEGAERVQRKIAQLANAREKFVDASPEKALEFLCSADSGEAGRAFDAYMIRHGHRGISEMDIRANEWSHDPRSLIISLQGAVAAMLAGCAESAKAQPVAAPLWLRPLVKLTQSGVRGREYSKSRLVKVKSYFKQAYRDLATHLVAEGKLPDTELVYFLTHRELGQLAAAEALDTDWIALAQSRLKIFASQQGLRFDDVCVGQPQPKVIDVSALVGLRKVAGRTVSRGKVTGRAKVARTLADAAGIQAGDILIAPITDVAWTPYFSIISGLATDIGSAVSHGAVVAREFGLPCIVKTEVGTQVFNDGDLVTLDADNGLLYLAE